MLLGGGHKKGKSEFFFFQAEDGIRDTSVTGVQTCALPISTFLYENWISIDSSPSLLPFNILTAYHPSIVRYTDRKSVV